MQHRRNNFLGITHGTAWIPAFAGMAMLAAFANIVPLLLVVPAGDTVMNYMLVECFSKQVWSGILYPRWCMEANGGLGSPAPIFYFPLPFYITALFAPVKHVEQQYLLGVFAANVTAFICAYAWLSRLGSRRTALFCAFIFLFGFYRAEMMTRASYAEYWCIAFMPLLFAYAHDACQLLRTSPSPQRGEGWDEGVVQRPETSELVESTPSPQPSPRWGEGEEDGRYVWLKFAVIITVCMLCHAPATLIGLMGASGYILMTRWRALGQLLTGSVIATLITVAHYVPMKLLAATLNDEVGGVNHWRQSWVNHFIEQLYGKPEQFWSLVGLGVALVSAGFIGAALLCKCRTLPEAAWREGRGWLVIGAGALFMMFSVSEPLWFPVEMISGVATPWRMQSLIMFALVACFALLAEHVWFKNPRTATGDKILCVLFFVFANLFYAGGVESSSIDAFRRLKAMQFTIPYFAPRDVDTRYKNVDVFFHDFIDRPNRPQAQWLTGSGDIKVEQWNERGIIIKGHASTAGTLRLEHFYYPLWQAEVNGKPVDIKTEAVQGRMVVAIPTGKFRLELKQVWPISKTAAH